MKVPMPRFYSLDLLNAFGITEAVNDLSDMLDLPHMTDETLEAVGEDL